MKTIEIGTRADAREHAGVQVNTSTSFQEFSPVKLEALADGFELLSLAFSFPTLELSEALTSGSFQADLACCLDELEISTPTRIECAGDSQDLYASMRREYSRLYHSPGKLAVLYLYESAFLFSERRGEGFPVLISNPITINVERHMAAAGALPKTARREPVDSVFEECAFMSHLFTQALSNTFLDTEEGTCNARQWIHAAHEFYCQHIETWLPMFMDRTIELSRSVVYRQLAESGKAILSYGT